MWHGRRERRRSVLTKPLTPFTNAQGSDLTSPCNQMGVGTPPIRCVCFAELDARLYRGAIGKKSEAITPVQISNDYFQ